MEIITEAIGLHRLREMAVRRFGEMIKAVVDVEQGIMAVDAELHADEEEALLERGSAQANLWGINLYPDVAGEEWIEFDSLINLRPSQGNRSRGVDDPGTRKRIAEVVSRLVAR
ncbi:MAG: hypothetical protein H6Q86_1202 [candidate division NC10 bacterium]|jgi:hypothetical protein|nr:hypothetical protein [candidate division NC10 bacterium]